MIMRLTGGATACRAANLMIAGLTGGGQRV